MQSARRRVVEVVDSHTGGEPTRVVVAGGPDLGRGPMRERLERLRRDHDDFRAAVVNEPRGSDVLVGALLTEPHEERCAAGVIFFNNVGYLGMCGHGTMGVVITLAHLGRLSVGPCRIETPVGAVDCELLADGQVRIENVASFRHARAVTVEVSGHGAVTGDVAFGGNWFFLADVPASELRLDNIERLTAYARAVRAGLARAGVTGAAGAEIDHIELSGPSPRGLSSRNFVLCPGHAYDRSPCGTGTSAKVACLHADGKLAPGAVFRQESITGSVFEARVLLREGRVHPIIQGRAFLTAEARLIIDADDPFAHGIGSAQLGPHDAG